MPRGRRRDPAPRHIHVAPRIRPLGISTRGGAAIRPAHLEDGPDPPSQVTSRGKRTDRIREALGDVAAGASMLSDFKIVVLSSAVLAIELRRVQACTDDPGLRAAQGRAKAQHVERARWLRFVVDAADDDGPRTTTARVSVADALTLGREHGANVVQARERLLEAAGDPAKLQKIYSEMDPLRKVHVQAVVDGRRKCQLRTCQQLEAPGTKFLRCSRCKQAAYCSQDCQVMDWTALHHKRVCKALPKATVGAAAPRCTD